MTDLFSPLTFTHGPAMKNRFILAPLTNLQSHADGSLSDEEFNFLRMRAEGGFGMVMTCAVSVQAVGRVFPGQLGFHDDSLLPGLTRLASALKAGGSLATAQLHHGGIRAPAALVGMPPVGPSDDAQTGARALSTAEVEKLAEDFIAAACRADKAGFDGVEIHGAHGYLLCQFLSAELNQRKDKYGGSLTNRARLIRDIIAGIRTRCRADFWIGLRLSPERFGMKMSEILTLAQEFLTEAQIDLLDMSLWDVFKEPEEEAFKGKSLLEHFTRLDRGPVRLTAAGHIRTGAAVRRAMESGLDCVMIGRGAILHHDFPKRMEADADFVPIAQPVPVRHLTQEGISKPFLDYLRSWKGFVEGS